MKLSTAAFLALTLAGMAMPQTSGIAHRDALVAAEMEVITGGDFWGGVTCGAAAAGSALGVTAIVTAAGAGTTLAFAVYFGTSVALHISALCAMIE